MEDRGLDIYRSNFVLTLENYFSQYDILRDIFVQESKKSSQTSFQNYITQFYSENCQLIASNDETQKISSMLKIATLIKMGLDEMYHEKSTTLLFDSLQGGGTENFYILKAKIFTLAMKYIPNCQRFVDKEVVACIEKLKQQNSRERFYAIYLFHELCISVPTAFLQYIDQFFQVIFYAVNDSESKVRTNAAYCIRSCLLLCLTRESKKCSPPYIFKLCYEKVFSVLERWLESGDKNTVSNETDVFHGHLLLLNELLVVVRPECYLLRKEFEAKFVDPFSQNQTAFSRGQTNFVMGGNRDSYFSENGEQDYKDSRHLTKFVLSPSDRSNFGGIIKDPQSTNAYAELLIKKFDIIHKVVCKANSQKLSQIKTNQVIQVMLEISANLAFLDKTKYQTECIKDTIHFMIECINMNKNSNLAFQSFCVLCSLLKSVMQPYAVLMLGIIKNRIVSRETNLKHQIQAESMELACLWCIAYSDQDITLSDLFRDTLEVLLTRALFTPSIAACLVNLSILTKNRDKFIHDQLSVILTKIIAGTEKPENSDRVVLALKTLCSFECDAALLNKFINIISEKYFFCECKEIRMESIETCCKLMNPEVDTVSTQSSPLSVTFIKNHQKMVNSVIKGIIKSGVSDLDPQVRTLALRSLTHKYYSFLVEMDNLMMLIPTLHDESIMVRRAALILLGRLCEFNSAYTLPILVKFLVELLSTLKFSTDTGELNNSSMLLRLLITNCKRVAVSAMVPVLTSLKDKFSLSSHEDFVVNAVSIFGEMTVKCGISAISYQDPILEICIQLLSENVSMAKKEAVLGCITKLFRFSGYTESFITIYIKLRRILFSMLQRENHKSVRSKIIRVLGLFGPIDHRICAKKDTSISETPQMCRNLEDSSEKSADVPQVNLVDLPSEGIEEFLNIEFYPFVIISSLLQTLEDSSMNCHQKLIYQTLDDICICLAVDFQNFVDMVMPYYLLALQHDDSSQKKIILKILRGIVLHCKDQLRPYLSELFNIVNDIWIPNIDHPTLFEIIYIIENLITVLRDESRVILPSLVPKIAGNMLYVASTETQDSTSYLIARLLAIVQNTCMFLTDYFYCLIPVMVSNFDNEANPIQIRLVSLETLEVLCLNSDIRDYFSIIIHSLIRILKNCPDLRNSAMNVVYCMMYRMGKPFELFVPWIQKVFKQKKLFYPRFETILETIIHSTFYEWELEIMQLESMNKKRKFLLSSNIERQTSSNLKSKKLPTPQLNTETGKLDNSDSLGKFSFETESTIEKLWDNSFCTSRTDWIQWMKKLNIELIKDSPSAIIRTCYACSISLPSLAQTIFNIAFFSSWILMNAKQRSYVIKNLENVLQLQHIPEIQLTVLNLTEFMNHIEKINFPLKNSHLAACAEKCHAYSKALFYHELEFKENKTDSCAEKLISINNKLNNFDAAQGVVKYAVEHFSGDLKSQQKWYEKLHDWENALTAYQKRLMDDPHDSELILGKMRCLEALGEWDELKFLVFSFNEANYEEHQQTFSIMGASASLGLGDWESLNKFSRGIQSGTLDGNFYRALVSIKNENHSAAQFYIESARDILDSELSGLTNESFERTHGCLVTAQILTELEELMIFQHSTEHRKTILENWRIRLTNGQGTVDDWQKILLVHSVVLPPTNDVDNQLKFASICRKSNKFTLATKIINKLIGEERFNVERLIMKKYTSNIDPMILYQYYKILWEFPDRKMIAYENLLDLVEKFQIIVSSGGVSDLNNTPVWNHRISVQSFFSKCCYKLAEWEQNILPFDKDSAKKSFEHYLLATKYRKESRKMWHSFGLLSYNLLLHHKKIPVRSDSGSEEIDSSKFLSDEEIVFYCKAAFSGFFRSVNISEDSRINSLQDILRILTLWFQYGNIPEIYETLWDQIKSVKLENWLMVITQLIARINTTDCLVSRLIERLLSEIAMLHPQALIYPLAVGYKDLNFNESSDSLASQILSNMYDRNPEIVEQALMVSKELVRVSILWHELWYQGIEDISILYFNDQNIHATLRLLDSLYEAMEAGPQTLKEISFIQSYGRDLVEAKIFCTKFRETNDMGYLNQAFDYYYTIYNKLNVQLKKMSTLELQYVSPRLLSSSSLKIAIPGTYQPFSDLVCIESFEGKLKVMTSKQRPRKLSILGTNGKCYSFLLKGHEDLRQDERVMQLFGLVNALLSNHAEASKRNLDIIRYSVVPLSTNSGLIGWVSHCDTLENVVRVYRKRKKINMKLEIDILSKTYPNHYNMTIQQKAQAFNSLLASNQGNEVRDILWTNSPNAEEWFLRRNAYSRSLAVMSMVGYILGLGDRHPSNLLIERTTGKILHIDFGDCFEVAMTRTKFPEKVPFRLTRMLVNALEVTGIDGTFEIICNLTMSIMREQKDSLLAILEAFLYDPLLDWKLLAQDNDAAQKRKGRSENKFLSDNDDEAELAGSMTEERKTLVYSGASSDMYMYKSKSGVLNEKAVKVVNRIIQKLTGHDFHPTFNLDVRRQVNLLIKQATKADNLAQSFQGWCPFW